MSEIIQLNRFQQRPTHNFTRAAKLLAANAVLIPRRDLGDVDLQGGYRLEDLNEIYEKKWNSLHTGRDWMFVQIFRLMEEADVLALEENQADPAKRKSPEEFARIKAGAYDARDRLLAIVTGLNKEALDNIGTLNLGVYDSYVPKDAILRFMTFATHVRQHGAVRNNYGQPLQHNADVLAFGPRLAYPAPAAE